MSNVIRTCPAPLSVTVAGHNRIGLASLLAKSEGERARTILFGRANQRAVGQIGRGVPRNSPFGRAQRDRTQKAAASGTSRLDCLVGWSFLEVFKELLIHIVRCARDKA